MNDGSSRSAARVSNRWSPVRVGGQARERCGRLHIRGETGEAWDWLLPRYATRAESGADTLVHVTSTVSFLGTWSTVRSSRESRFLPPPFPDIVLHRSISNEPRGRRTN